MINRQIWLSLEKPVREKLVELFNIPKSSSVEVFDNRVVCDGYTDTDLMNITEEKIDAILSKGQSSLPKDFSKKWEYLITDIQNLLNGVSVQYDVESKVVIEEKNEEKNEETKPQNKRTISARIGIKGKGKGAKSQD